MRNIVQNKRYLNKLLQSWMLKGIWDWQADTKDRSCTVYSHKWKSWSRIERMHMQEEKHKIGQIMNRRMHHSDHIPLPTKINVGQNRNRRKHNLDNWMGECNYTSGTAPSSLLAIGGK